MQQIEEWMQVARQAAIEAGQAILDIYHSADFGVEQKTDDSPLTKADRAAHLLIVKHLEGTGLPILSEEGKHLDYEERKAWDYFWMVDPLDGTKEFIKKNGEFTVNIALIHEGKAVAGVLFSPVLGWLYSGISGKGAWKEHAGSLEKLQVEPDVVKVIVASRSHLSQETEEYMQQFPDASAISMGSSLKFMLVAEGKAELYPRFAPTMEWDTAAAQAIIEAAGAVVLQYPELSPLKYNKENLLNPWFVVGHEGIIKAV